MSDERAYFPETDVLALADDLAFESDAFEPSIDVPRPGVTNEILRIRWDTPRGRRVRGLVIRDVRFEKSAHLKEILHDLRCADEVKGFLDLRFVKLDGENLNGTQLAGADLTGASLGKTQLVSANLTGARLVKARLTGATLREADLSRADLSDANLTEAVLDAAALVSSELVRARCIGTSFRGATLISANLRGAMLARAVFEGADLGGASVAGAHVLPRAFELAVQRPDDISAALEVPCGGEHVAATRRSTWLASSGRARACSERRRASGRPPGSGVPPGRSRPSIRTLAGTRRSPRS